MCSIIFHAVILAYIVACVCLVTEYFRIEGNEHMYSMCKTLVLLLRLRVGAARSFKMPESVVVVVIVVVVVVVDGVTNRLLDK